MRLAACVIGVIAGLLVRNAWAENYVYTGPYAGAWDNSLNWSPNGVPGAADTATVSSYSRVDVNSSITIGTLNVNNAEVSTFSPTITVTTALNLTNANISNAIIAGSATFTSSSTSTNVASNVTNNGTITVSSGALSLSYCTNLGTLATSGSGRLYVGDYVPLNHSGSLTGVMDCRGSLVLSGAPTCPGVLNLLGSGSVDSSTTAFDLTGTLTMRDSTRINCAMNTGPASSVNLSNGYSLMFNSTTVIGGAMTMFDCSVVSGGGTGTLQIATGGTLTGNSAFYPTNVMLPIENNGTITAASGQFHVVGISINNAGTLASAPGASIRIEDYTSFTNSGTIAGTVQKSSGTLNVSGASTCSGTLILNGTLIQGTGTLSVTGALRISQQSYVEAQLAIGPTGSLVLEGASVSIFNNSSLNCSGTIVLNDASLNGGGLIQISSGGLVISNSTNYWRSVISGNFSNAGTLRADSGTLNLWLGSTESSGVIASTGNAVVQVTDHNFGGISTGTLAVGGTLNLTGPATCSGSVFLNSQSQLQGAGSLNVTGTVTSSGNVTISAPVNVGPTGLLRITDGSVWLSAPVASSGTLSLEDATVSGFGSGAITNNVGAQLQSTGSYSGNSLYVPVTNNGTITANAGTLTLINTSNTGTMTSSGSGVLRVPWSYTLNHSGTLAGVLALEGTLNSSSPIALANGSIQLSGGTISGQQLNVYGSISTGGTSTLSAPIFIAPGAALNINSFTNTMLSAGLHNNGVVTVDGGNLSAFGSGALYNEITGVITTAPTNSIASLSVLYNYGTFTNSAGSISIQTYTQESGTTSLEGGTLATGTAYINGGTLSGEGWNSAEVVNAATVLPGRPVGTLTVWSYTQNAAGTTAFDLTSVASYDRLQVSGNASVNGTLTATLASGYVIPAHAQFNIINATNVFGTFSSVNIPSGLVVNYAYNAVSLVKPNQAPSAAGDSFVTNEDATLDIAYAALLANDTDGDNDTLSIASWPSYSTAGGTLTFISPSTIRYTPPTNYHGTDSFDYAVNDGYSGTSSATVSLQVNSINDNPFAANDSAETNEDAPVSIAATTLKANDFDIEGDTLTVIAVSAASAQGGTVVLADGQVTYTPVANFNGADSFTYTVSDGNGGTALGTVNVAVAPMNDAPVAANDNAATSEDTAVVISAASLAANDSDVDGDAVTVTAVSATSAQGGAVVLADGDVTYTPAVNFNGADSFTYTVSDGNGGVALGTVVVTVAAVNDAPVAISQSLSTAEDTSLPIELGGTDVEGSTLTYAIVQEPTYGTLSGAPPSIVYTPNPNYFGNDSFTFKVNDGSVDSAEAAINIAVSPVNDLPVAQDQNLIAVRNVALPITLAATDVDGDALTYRVIQSTGHGTLTGTPPNITYTPATNYVGADVFTFVANDGTGDGNIATVNIMVNAPPTAAVTSPAANTVFQAGANITINAAATDSDGTVAKVEFYYGAAKIGEDLTSPYSIVWSNAPAGTYVLTAVSTDNRGTTTTSAGIAIIVNAPPACAITSPANNSTFSRRANIAISATAADSDGTITKVEFYRGSTKMATDTTAPYAHTWTNANTGTYVLTVRAYDNRGAITISAGITVTVQP